MASAASKGKFIQFGCWNQGLCHTEEVAASVASDSITRVMHTLKDYVAINAPDFIVVAGDNYYPRKEEKDGIKKKYIEPVNMASGFKCLPLDIPIDMILGNHDLETNTGADANLFITDDSVKETDCFITTKEIELATNINISFVVNKARLLNGHTLVLMIDTSMYDDSDIEDMFPCYKKMPGYAGIPDVAALRANQWGFIREEIEKYKKTGQLRNIIIIGHHPITGYKHSIKVKVGSKPKPKLELMTGFASFIDMLVNGIYKSTENTVKYYYLCADLHLYQEGTIQFNGGMTINQYIVGTGGTKLDLDPMRFEPAKDFSRPESFSDSSDKTVPIGTYIMNTEQSRRVHGFLECDFRSEALTFNFIPVSESVSVSKGGRRRNSVYKRTKRTKRRRSRSRSRQSRSRLTRRVRKRV